MKARPEFISIGIIIKAHGIKGEVLVRPITDDPDQFSKLTKIYLTRDDIQEEYQVQDAKIRDKGIYLKLKNVDNRDTAESLKGSFLERRLSDLKKLPRDTFYIFDLIGLKVLTMDNTYIGKITDVWTLPANDVYVVKNGDHEVLIPAVSEIVKKVDLENETLIIEPIDGLI